MSTATESTILNQILTLLEPLDDASRVRILRTVHAFYNTDITPSTIYSPSKSPLLSINALREPVFGAHANITPKDFLSLKKPSTDVERVACLGYYLTHYRDTPHFKTTDITTLNTEAAQQRFSNTAMAVSNATAQGYLVPSINGCKQLSAGGEHYVELLPDRDASRKALQQTKRVKFKRKQKPTGD